MIVALSLLAGLALVPAWTPLQLTPPAQWLGAALGIGAGAVLQRAVTGGFKVRPSVV
jgi:hypothetical protein